MTASYSRLFTIEMLHEYFLNRKCHDLEIVPSMDCQEISRKMNIQWRKIENQLVGLIKENNVNEPFINVPPQKSYRKYYSQTVFRFYINLKNPLFFNYTNIDLSYTAGRKCYFSNLANNIQNGILNLTSPVADYVPGTTYLPGALVKDSVTGNVYESLIKNNSRKKNALTDHSLWAPKGLLHLSRPVEEHSISKAYLPGDLTTMPGSDHVFETVRKHISRSNTELNDQSIWASRGNGQLQYATDSDSIECCNNNYIFKVASPVTTVNIAVYGFNYDSAAPAYDLKVEDVEVRSFKRPTTEVCFNLSRLKPGRYVLEVNTEKRTVYYDPVLNRSNAIGVIEIFNHLTGSNDYALLDDEEKIKKPKYTVQFANRRVLWKYKPKDGKAEKILDIGETGHLFTWNSDAFVSATPIPLAESVLKTLKLEFNTKDFTMFPLPNPNYERLGKCTQNDYDYWCSEIYLNY